MIHENALSRQAGPPAQVLVVDDDQGLRDICRKTLAGSGFSVVVARDGDEAWALFQSGNFDLVLTDIHMPGAMSGVRLVAEIKQRSPATEVVIMTGVPELETAIPALKSGAYDYLMKPFTPTFLESAVARCMEKRRLSRELGREKIMRAELEAAYRELQKVERLKQAILARVHHELRAPLTVALVAAECLSEEPLSDKGRRLAGKVLVGIADLKDRVEEILLHAELQKGDLSLALSPVDLRQLIEKVVAQLKSPCEAKNLSIERCYDDSIGARSLDAALAETACRNLLLNAVKFSQRDGKIRIAVKKMDAAVAVSFTDSGIGIPVDQLPRLADGFYQVAESLTRKVGGLGLGLAIVRRIAEAHGGSISVSSREGQGSTFTLVFPAQSASER